jgi:hypothetical protein
MQVLGPPLGGFLAETTGGFLAPFLLAGLVAAAGAGLSVDVLRATRAGREPETSSGRAEQP